MAEKTQAEVAELQQLAQEVDNIIQAWVEKKLAQPNMETYNMVTTFKENLGKGAFLTPFGFVDGASDTIEGWALNNPLEYGSQAVVYVRKVKPSGTVLREAILVPEDDAKVDGATAWQSGDVAVVLGTGHELKSEPRDNGAYKVGLAGWCTPYPHGEVPLGKAGAFVPVSSGGGGGGEPVDYAAIQRGVDQAMHTTVNNMIPKGIITLSQALDDKLRADRGGPNPAGWTDEMRQEVQDFQDRLFNFVKNANAGVQVNIIHGQDDWGKLQRQAFIAMIREALRG